MTAEEITAEATKRYNEALASLEADMNSACAAGMEAAVQAEVDEMVGAAQAAEQGTVSKVVDDMIAEQKAKAEADAAVAEAEAESAPAEEVEMTDEEKITMEYNAMVAKKRAELQAKCDQQVADMAALKFAEWEANQPTASAGGTKPKTTGGSTTTTTTTDPGKTGTTTTTTTGATKGGTTGGTTVTKGGQTGGTTGTTTEEKPKVTKGGN
jgi:hypothetical protein